MPRETYVIRNGRAVPKHLAAPLRVQNPSALPRPMIISDACELRSMADGQIYTSKSAYYADIRARGLEIVGNDSSLHRKRTPIETSSDPSRDRHLWDQHVGA